jgi:hypothetical protein
LLRRAGEAGLAVAARLRSWIALRRARSVTYESARGRVRKGAEHLDRIDPWWFRRIRKATPDGGREVPKILGQLQGAFLAGLATSGELDLRMAARSGPSPVDLGFLSLRSVSEELRKRDSCLLNQAWHEEVRHRQEQEEAEVAILMHSIEVSVAAFQSTGMLEQSVTRAER